MVDYFIITFEIVCIVFMSIQLYINTNHMKLIKIQEEINQSFERELTLLTDRIKKFEMNQQSDDSYLY
jgi:hypothetical protein